MKVYPLIQNSNAKEEFKVIASRKKLDFSFVKPVFKDINYLMIGTENQEELNKMLDKLKRSSKIIELPYKVGSNCS